MKVARLWGIVPHIQSSIVLVRLLLGANGRVQLSERGAQLQDGVLERRNLLDGPSLEYLARILIARRLATHFLHMFQELVHQLVGLGVDFAGRRFGCRLFHVRSNGRLDSVRAPEPCAAPGRARRERWCSFPARMPAYRALGPETGPLPFDHLMRPSEPTTPVDWPCDTG